MADSKQNGTARDKTPTAKTARPAAKPGPYGHTDYDQTSQAASSALRPEEDDKNPDMPCKNSLPT